MIGSHCICCGVAYETPSRPACECAGDPPVDRDSLEYEAYLDKVRRLRFDRGPQYQQNWEPGYPEAS